MVPDLNLPESIKLVKITFGCQLNLHAGSLHWLIMTFLLITPTLLLHFGPQQAHLLVGYGPDRHKLIGTMWQTFPSSLVSLLMILLTSMKNFGSNVNSKPKLC